MQLKPVCPQAEIGPRGASLTVLSPTRGLVMQGPARNLTHTGSSALPYIASTDRSCLESLTAQRAVDCERNCIKPEYEIPVLCFRASSSVETVIHPFSRALCIVVAKSNPSSRRCSPTPRIVGVSSSVSSCVPDQLPNEACTIDRVWLELKLSMRLCHRIESNTRVARSLSPFRARAASCLVAKIRSASFHFTPSQTPWHWRHHLPL